MANAGECRANLLRLGEKQGREATMLKITKIDTQTEQRVILEGQLIEPWIADFKSHWKETRQAHRERKFVVDLRGVLRIDSAGEEMLALMKAEGAKFLVSGVRMKQLIRDLEGRTPQDDKGQRRVLGRLAS
jgi:anti-anti-sigma regulatory factor